MKIPTRSAPGRNATLLIGSFSILTALIAVGVIIQPLLIFVLPLVAILIRTIPSAGGLSITLILAGPVLASRYALAGLTLDNWLTIAGAILGVAHLLFRKGAVDFRLAALPLALAGTVLLSVLAAGTGDLAAIIRYLSLAVLAIVIVGKNQKIRRHAERGLVVVMTVGAISVLLQPLLPSILPPYIDPDSGSIRLGGLFGHPNFAASSLALFALYVLASRVSSRKLTILALVLVLPAVLFTSSLGAIVALLVCAAVLLVTRLGRMLVALLLAGVVFALFGSTFVDRIGFFLSSDTDANSVGWRLRQWSQALELMPQLNFFGVGWGMIETITGSPAHNAYLAIVVELGFVGALIVLVGWVVSQLRIGFKRAGIVLGAFVAATSITDPTLYYPSTLAAYLIVGGLTAAMSSQEEVQSAIIKRTTHAKQASNVVGH